MHTHGTLLPAHVRRAVVNRDGGKCRLCWSTYRLHVHHLDEHGQNNIAPNHDPANLVTLCRPCHMRLHLEDMRLTPEIIARADRVRAGEELLLARQPLDGQDYQLVGDSIPLSRNASMRPEVAFFKDHPEEDCPEGCECGVESLGLRRPHAVPHKVRRMRN